MAQMNISNTLWNDTREALLAYVKQLKDDTINWSVNDKKYNGTYPNPNFNPELPVGPDNPETLPIIPSEFKTESNKFQDKLNDFFLNHWADWQTFLNDKDLEDSTINTWKELEEFLATITDSDEITLVNLITNSQLLHGSIRIEMSETVPGMIQAISDVLVPSITNSFIDEETGIIRLIYNVE